MRCLIRAPVMSAKRTLHPFGPAASAIGEFSREGARRVVEVVKEFGLQPVEPLPALSPITADDVGVVCWMAVRPE